MRDDSDLVSRVSRWILNTFHDSLYQQTQPGRSREGNLGAGEGQLLNRLTAPPNDPSRAPATNRVDPDGAVNVVPRQMALLGLLKVFQQGSLRCTSNAHPSPAELCFLFLLLHSATVLSPEPGRLVTALQPGTHGRTSSCVITAVTRGIYIHRGDRSSIQNPCSDGPCDQSAAFPSIQVRELEFSKPRCRSMLAGLVDWACISLFTGLGPRRPDWSASNETLGFEDQARMRRCVSKLEVYSADINV